MRKNISFSLFVASLFSFLFLLPAMALAEEQNNTVTIVDSSWWSNVKSKVADWGNSVHEYVTNNEEEQRRERAAVLVAEIGGIDTQLSARNNVIQNYLNVIRDIENDLTTALNDRQVMETLRAEKLKELYALKVDVIYEPSMVPAGSAPVAENTN